MNTVPDIEAHGTAVGSYENDIETKTVTGLLPGATTWGTGSALTLTTDGNVSPTGDLTLDITDLGQIVASGATRFIKVDAGGSIRIKNRKKFTVRPKTKYRFKIKV